MKARVPVRRKKQRRNLSRYEILFQSVWEKSVDGMRLTDEDGIIIAVNQAYCDLVGIEREDLVGKIFTTAYAASEHLDRILQKYRQRFQTRHIETLIERKLTFRSGKAVELEVTNSFIELPGKKPLVLGLFRDITARKETEAALHKSESQFRLVWENTLDGLRLVDGRGMVRVVNEAYCRLVGRPRETLIGRSLREIYEPQLGAKILQEHVGRFRRRTILPTLEREIVLWNERKLIVQVTNSFLEIAGQPLLLLSAFRDLTDQKHVQARMQRLEQQRALEKERQRIAKDMHDDLGGSLTRITLLSEIIEAEMARGDRADRPTIVSRLQKMADTSREVVRNMDEIVWAVNPGNDSLENFASYICHATEELFKMTPINCRLGVPAILPNYFLGSEVRHNLFLAVKEALSNVVKHSGASEVQLQMETRHGHFIITISDNGRGFDLSKISRFANGVSNMFQRMTEIGAEFAIKSKPRSGTVATLKVNLESQSPG